MKSVTNINLDSDDQLDVKKVIRNGLVLLSFAITVLSGAALWTIIELTDFYKNKVNTLSMQTHQLHVMRITARERTLLSYAIISEDDHFKADAIRMKIYKEGLNFTLARLNLTKSYLSENEIRILNKQSEIAIYLEPKQEQFLDDALTENKGAALKVIRDEIIPNQVKLIKILDELSISIEKRHNDIIIKADSLSQTSIIILMSMVIIFILGAVYIFRQTTSRSSVLLNRLSDTRKMLQDTIHELIQQKDTLDYHAIVSIADKQGNITYVNDKFCEVSGYRRDDLIGKNHRILKSDMHSEEFYQNLWNTISQGEIWQGEICNRHKNNGNYWVKSTISPFLDDMGIPYQYVSIRTDITELVTSKIKAEESSRAKSLFISSMSHEIRTPLNAILGFSQIVKMNIKDEASKENLQRIVDGGQHLLNLINEVLSLANIESGKLDLVINSYSLKNILEFCLKMIKPSADRISIQIDNQINALSDINIQVDEEQIKQVIINLLSNAVNYNNEKGKVIINYSLENDLMLKLIITDTGKGIASDKQNNLFNPFDRAGQENFGIRGAGLGLVISKNLIEKMKGTIGFESTEGEGSSFWIKMPLS